MKRWLGYLWRVPVVAVAFIALMPVGNALVSALGLAMPTYEGQVEAGTQAGLAALGALVLALGLGLVADRLRRGFYPRWLGLAFFAFVAVGLNTAFEAAAFTTLDAMSAMIFLFVPSVLGATAVAAALFGPRSEEAVCHGAYRDFTAQPRAALRLLLAWLAFPFVYYLFGMLLMVIRPELMDFYTSGESGLTLPDQGQILQLQLIRGGFALFSISGLLLLWEGGRGAFTVRVGFALWALMGLFGMIQGTWLDPALRIGHGLEIGCDAFAYTGLVAWLLLPKEQEARTEPEASS